MTPIHFTPLYRVQPRCTQEGFILSLQRKRWLLWWHVSSVEIVLCNVKMPGAYTKFKHFELWNTAEFSVKKRSEKMFVENVKIKNMKKISTLYKKDPNDLSRVVNEVDPENEWALTEGVATRKFDGTAAAIINGELYKRYDVKKGRNVPANAIPCQEPDAITGHWPHWVKCDRNNKEDKWFFEGLENAEDYLADGTYELIGPKINGNKENFCRHELIKHGCEKIYFGIRTFEKIKDVIEEMPFEGIVFHHPDGRMCKIRKSDFGIKR